MKLKTQFNCCHCKMPVYVASARFCDGHSAYEGDRRTLVCASCGQCACDRVDDWRESREIKEEGWSPIPFGRFDWVHKDLIEESGTRKNTP